MKVRVQTRKKFSSSADFCKLWSVIQSSESTNTQRTYKYIYSFKSTSFHSVTQFSHKHQWLGYSKLINRSRQPPSSPNKAHITNFHPVPCPHWPSGCQENPCPTLPLENPCPLPWKTPARRADLQKLFFGHFCYIKCEDNTWCTTPKVY